MASVPSPRRAPGPAGAATTQTVAAGSLLCPVRLTKQVKVLLEAHSWLSKSEKIQRWVDLASNRLPVTSECSLLLLQGAAPEPLSQVLSRPGVRFLSRKDELRLQHNHARESNPIAAQPPQKRRKVCRSLPPHTQRTQHAHMLLHPSTGPGVPAEVYIYRALLWNRRLPSWPGKHRQAFCHITYR